MKNKPIRLSILQRGLLFVKNHWFVISCLGIFLLALSLRFYHFSSRWGLGNDDARDVAIALEALRRHELPLIGSFSSAGPFAFGPFFYWFIMLCDLLLPFVFTAPWIGVGVISLLTIGVLMVLAYQLEGRVFALLVGLLATISPQLVARSLTLGQHSFIALFAALSLLMLVLLFKHTRWFYALVFGLCIGAAINFHYQAVNLIIFIPVLLFLPKTPVTKKLGLIVLAGLGVVLGLSPLLYWDSHQSFANMRNLLDYLLVGQYRLYVPNSWRLFIFTYLPEYWAFVIGGYHWVGFAVMVVTGITFAILAFLRKLPYVWYYLMIPFGILLFVNRYYKGERSEGYLLYLLPLILIASAYVLYALWQNKMKLFRVPLLLSLVAGIIFLAVVIGDAVVLPQSLSYTSPVADFERTIKTLTKKYPGQKFSVYDYQDRFPYQSQPLGTLLGKEHLISPDGMPIGVICYIRCPVEKFPTITTAEGLAVVNLSQVGNLSQQKKTWTRRNPADMYDSLIGWSQKHELTATFSLQEYLMHQLHLR